jgi:hypothetical protein
MSWSSSQGVRATIGLFVEHEDDIRFVVNPEQITLVLGESAEITFDESVIRSLKDKVDAAVNGT